MGFLLLVNDLPDSLSGKVTVSSDFRMAESVSCDLSNNSVPLFHVAIM